MGSIYILKEDEILHILQFLDLKDRIAFAYACEKFRQICMNQNVFRKLDLSRCVIRRQQGAIVEMFKDKQMAQHIRELNLNNHHVMNWQKHVELHQLILPKCNQLEALHVLNCGTSLRTIHSILQQASKMTTLSFSLMDISREDIDFLLDSPDAICLENIRYLHLEIPHSKPHFRILKYLVLSHCKCLEELEILIWQILDVHGIRRKWENLLFNQPSSLITDTLQHFHSLMLEEVCDLQYPCWINYSDLGVELCDFIFKLVTKKSRATKWKKFYISPPIDSNYLQHMFHLNDSIIPLSGDHMGELHSVEFFTAHACMHTMPSLDKLKTLFQSIDDNTLKNLHLYASHYEPTQIDSILETFHSILRTGGPALRCFKLSMTPQTHLVDTQLNEALNTLFSSCSNITELDLLGCHFEKIICESLSKLLHLHRIQVPHCAILSEQVEENHVDEAGANFFSFVENCQNITEFEVRGCIYHYVSDPCDNLLLALSRLTKLKSLTLYDIFCIREWTFLKNLSEYCQFLTTLRIMITKYGYEDLYFIHSTILESTKFLKHLVIHMKCLDLAWEDLWKLLSQATNLERLCIRSEYEGSLNIEGAMEMLKSLPGLHVLHLHCHKVKNLEIFHNHISRIMEEEKSDRGYCFEFLTDRCSVSMKGNPLNIAELCDMVPCMSLPSF